MVDSEARLIVMDLKHRELLGYSRIQTFQFMPPLSVVLLSFVVVILLCAILPKAAVGFT